ncbi:hypothetical protein Tco_0749973 [Tanacetum coccineum]|uniref:Uncharacterized protein n=1 Tax=Tanacetum coccineum TaxID=301880 RepID=A0ABQ4Z0R8_9ASTR
MVKRKKPSLHLGRNQVNTYAIRTTKLLFGIEDSHHGPTEYDESNTYVLERFYTLAGNPVKEILLKLNLPDHRSILTDSKIHIKMDMEIFYINALHLNSAKTIMTLNEENTNLNNQLSKENSTVSFLNEEKKRLKSDFKILEDELLDKQIQLENKIKELDNILVKTGKSIQMMHMLSPKSDSFYHNEQKMALGYQNPCYLKKTKQKQQSLYNGKVLLEKHDPPAVYDSEETLQLAQETGESLAKHKALEFEIERLLREVISRDIMSNVQNPPVIETSDLHTELERTKARFENCIIKKENEYDNIWNDWYTKCEECKYDKISYDKAYKDMQQKIEQLQAQLGDLKGKSKDTPCVSDTLDPLS